MVGEFRASEYVRTEKLAETLGVSPTPVREALMILGSEGVVRWEPRRGYRVVPIRITDVRDLFSVQAFIAGELAARAATMLTDEDLIAIDEIQVRLVEAAASNDPSLVDELNHRVHRLINRASGSTRMATLLNQTVHYVPLSFFGTIEGWAEASVHDHIAVIAALHARDSAMARASMSAHIENIGGLLIDHLERHKLLPEA
ncbi:MAG: ydhC [Nocardioidaceae bacterium]|nr:ydhC [Nocardioidaceae bacterium]